jgi:undecaprenyl-diphosphatase
MNLGQALILSVVEGVTEFLPISSTGHLILASRLLGIFQSDFVKSFEIVIQLGAILAVVIMYAKKVLSKLELVKPILIAFVPTGVLGLVLYKLVKTYLLGNTGVTIGALLIGGIFMILFEKSQIPNLKSQTNLKSQISNLKPGQALLIGLFQSVSMIPGVSRAMATIFGGMMMGLSRAEATEFSFLLAIPTMAAATGLDLLKSGWIFTPGEWWLLTSGFIGAFVAAFAVVKWLIGYVQKHDFVAFGIYRIILALAFLVLI